jgi:ABC-2 type transport system permease protein
MLSLLKIEWLKLKNYRTFWILSVLYLVSIFGVNYIVYRVQQNIYEAKEGQGMAQMVLGRPPYEFPEVWHNASYWSSWLLFLPGLLMIITVTNEYSFKTHRQNIIDGWSRKEFITVKIAQALIWAFISTLTVFITAMLFGLQGESSIDFDKFYYLGYYFIQALSYSMVGLLFAVLFRRGGLAIGVFILYLLVLENLIALLLNRYMNFSGRYLPLESADNLIPFPVLQNMQKQLFTPPNYTALLVVSLVYLVLYFMFITKKFEADDL